MLNIFKKSKAQKISESKRAYHKKWGNTRRVPINHGSRTIAYLHMPKKKAGISYVGDKY